MSQPFLEEIPDLTPGQCGGGKYRRDGRRSMDVAAYAGCYVVPSGDAKAKLPTTAAEITKQNGGVLELLVDRVANASGIDYDATQYAMIVKEGGIVVATEQAVSDQDPVYVRFTSKGGNTILGKFRKDADPTAATVAITVVATADATEFRFVLNGVDLGWLSGAGQTAAQKATAWAAVIDATAEFSASAVGAVITVTLTPATDPVVGDHSPANVLTYAENSGATAARLPNHYFEHDAASGAAFVNIRQG